MNRLTTRRFLCLKCGRPCGQISENITSGHLRLALTDAIAERKPNFRALACGGDNAALVQSADHDRLGTQVRGVAVFDGGVECIHVDMEHEQEPESVLDQMVDFCLAALVRTPIPPSDHGERHRTKSRM